MPGFHYQRTATFALAILISPCFLAAKVTSKRSSKSLFKSSIVPHSRHKIKKKSTILRVSSMILANTISGFTEICSNNGISYFAKENMNAFTYNPYQLTPEMRALLLPDSTPTYTLFATILPDRINIKQKQVSIGQAMNRTVPAPLPIPDLPGSHDPGLLNGQQYYPGKRNGKMKIK